MRSYNRRKKSTRYFVSLDHPKSRLQVQFTTKMSEVEIRFDNEVLECKKSKFYEIRKKRMRCVCQHGNGTLNTSRRCKGKESQYGCILS